MCEGAADPEEHVVGETISEGFVQQAHICIVAAVVGGLMRLDSRSRSARLAIAERTARHCSRMIGRDLRA
jgi:hypothetical protein